MKKGMYLGLILINLTILILLGISSGVSCARAEEIFKVPYSQDKENYTKIKNEFDNQKELTSEQIAFYIGDLITIGNRAPTSDELINDENDQPIQPVTKDQVKALKLQLTEIFVDLNYEQVTFERLPCEYETWDYAMFYWYKNYSDLMQNDDSMTGFYGKKFEGLSNTCDIYDEHKIEREQLELERQRVENEEDAQDRSNLRGWYALWLLSTYLSK